MGLLVSLLRSRPNDSERPQSPPSHIPLPPPPVFGSFSLNPSPSSRAGDSCTDAPPSPCLQFYTAPSSPLVDSPPHTPSAQPPASSPPSFSALHISIPQPSTRPSERPTPQSPPDDTFPTVDLAIDLALDDEGLSTLEKIYLFSRSKATFHRVFIAHALPSFLAQVTPQEAIEYVLPLLSGLAMDEEEQVKEALAAELVPVIWWFFTHCQIIPDDLRTEETLYPSSTVSPTISVQAFTPILGTLLLSPNALVGGAARYAVVDLLSRMKKADNLEAGHHTAELASPDVRIGQLEDATRFRGDEEDVDMDVELATGLFGPAERAMFRQEIVQQVVIGMGRLDADIGMDFEGVFSQDYEERSKDTEGSMEVLSAREQGSGEEGATSPQQEGPEPKLRVVNPYFPVLASAFFEASPANSDASTPSSTSDSSAPTASSPAVSLNTTAAASPASAHREHDGFVPPSNFTPGLDARPSDNPPQEPMPDDWVPPAPRPGHAILPPRATSPPGGSSGPPPSSGYPSYVDELRSYEDEYKYDEYPPYDEGEGEQAAVGRLSSMSLMAAVTASGSLGDDTKRAFVTELERVGRDPVYWVRREASFALGALAKVVPEEVVVCSLIPLFDSLRSDSTWHVRHSALFALPAILQRLTPKDRRSLALETIIPLSTDGSSTVRSGVLEALGEVIYTFHQDVAGPPQELVSLFLGRREDRRVRDGQQTRLDSFYIDPERPHICAFNYPAVALTLGRERWGELRDVYLELAADRGCKVRQTLAASLGEMAKIIGADNAERDLVGVWWDAVRCEEDNLVREKAVECVDVFVLALGREAGEKILEGLLTVWDEGAFRGWRERECVARALVTFVESIGRELPSVIRGLLKRGLEDNVAAVREAAVSALPRIWITFATSTHVLDDLRADLRSLGQSTAYRRRMTFVACQQALALPDQHGQRAVPADDVLLTSISSLADDPIIGVRIGVARLLATTYQSGLMSEIFINIARRLSHDPSPEVISYLPDICAKEPRLATNGRLWKPSASSTTFSRPPVLPLPTPIMQSPNDLTSSDDFTFPHGRPFGRLRSSDDGVGDVAMGGPPPGFTGGPITAAGTDGSFTKAQEAPNNVYDARLLGSRAEGEVFSPLEFVHDDTNSENGIVVP